MNWFGATGTGTQSPAGARDGVDAMCGNAVMYDAVAGKILSAGGSPQYQDVAAIANARIITIGNAGSPATVTTIPNMAYARSFANAVILPDGTTGIFGGQSFPRLFADSDAVLTPEIYDPATNTFKKMAPNSIPRVYHSVALLLLDGTVFSGGGGLCGSCSTNHFDAQIFSPPYLFNSDGSSAVRPVINTVSTASAKVGTKFTVTTNVAVTRFSLIRYGSATHALNTDQRRIPLRPTATRGTTYTLTVPNDAGIAIPGYWMVFALNAAGVPSVAKSIKITIT